MSSASSPEGPGYNFLDTDQGKTFGQNQGAPRAARTMTVRPAVAHPLQGFGSAPRFAKSA